MRFWRASTSIVALVAAGACAPLPAPEALDPLSVPPTVASTTVLEARPAAVTPPPTAGTSLPRGRREELAAVIGVADGWDSRWTISGSVRTGTDTADGAAGLSFTGVVDGPAGASLVAVNLDTVLQRLGDDPTLSPSSRDEARRLLGAPFEVLSIGPVTWLRWPGLHVGTDTEPGWVETNAQRAEAFTAELGIGSSVVRPLWLLEVLSSSQVVVEELGAGDGGQDQGGVSGRHLRLSVDLAAALADVPPTERIAVLSEVGPGEVLTLHVWLDGNGRLRRFGYERYDDGDLSTPPTGAGTAVVVDLVEATDVSPLTPPAQAVSMDDVLSPPAPDQGPGPVD